jgi:hypothetical protein
MIRCAGTPIMAGKGREGIYVGAVILVEVPTIAVVTGVVAAGILGSFDRR